MIWTLGFALVVAFSACFAEAGRGIPTGKIDFTMVLDKSCSDDGSCLQICKDESKNPELIAGARCVKFVGKLNKYCCCYASTTNAWCQNGNSRLDCYPSTA